MFLTEDQMDDEYWESMSAYVLANEEPIDEEPALKDENYISVEWEDDEYHDIVHHLFARETESMGKVCVEVVIRVLIEDSGEDATLYFILDDSVSMDDIHDNVDDVELEEAQMYISKLDRITAVRKEICGKACK